VTFYQDTFAAKGDKPIVLGDVFGVKVPSKNALVWLQVTEVITNNTNNQSRPKGAMGKAKNALDVKAQDYNDAIGFRYRYNDDGKDYYAFDQTTEGAAYCNDNMVWANLPLQTGYWNPVNTPIGNIDVDSTGKIYIPAGYNLQILDPAGTTLTVSSFSNAVAVAVKKTAPVTAYVADAGLSIIYMMDGTHQQERKAGQLDYPTPQPMWVLTGSEYGVPAIGACQS